MVPISVSFEEPKKKNPRGRPRKDGRAAGSVPRVEKPLIKLPRGRPRKIQRTSSNLASDGDVTTTQKSIGHVNDNIQDEEEQAEFDDPDIDERVRTGQCSLFWENFPIKMEEDPEKLARQAK